jgi:hypothetical protein
VLPEGFQRIRYYGFLANRHRGDLSNLRNHQEAFRIEQLSQQEFTYGPTRF